MFKTAPTFLDGPRIRCHVSGVGRGPALFLKKRKRAISVGTKTNKDFVLRSNLVLYERETRLRGTVQKEFLLFYQSFYFQYYGTQKCCHPWSTTADLSPLLLGVGILQPA